MRLVMVWIVLGGCSYRAGSFGYVQHTFAGERVSVGCLDVAIERRAALIEGKTVIAYDFGNGCDHPAVVDLAAVGIVGRTRDGREVALAAFDPKHELRPVRLDGRSVGYEAIAYSSDGALAQVCVDAASIAQQGPARWVCL